MSAEPPRRVVTGHDAGGRSVILSDAPTPKSHELPGTAVFHEIWNTAATPAPVSPREPHEPTDRRLVTPPDPDGTIIRFVDLLPGSASPMHRTQTVDYGIVLSGEIHLVVDGDETRLTPGDVVVQRGTDHAWQNRTGQVARMAFVLVDGAFTDELKDLLPPASLENLYSRALDD